MGLPIQVIAVMLVAFVRVAHAGAEPDALRLSEVVAAAVRQSPELARARIDLDVARAQLMRVEGSEDTHLGGRAQGGVVRAAPTDPDGDSERETVAVSASRALPTGGTLGVTAAGDREKFPGVARDPSGTPIATVVSRYATAVTVQLAQPLLRGAGPAAFEAPIRQAARQRDAAALAREARARDLVVSLAQAYWQVAFAWRQLEVRKISLELAQQQLAYTEGAIRSEKVARSEALAVQQAIATRQQDVIAAEQVLYEQSLALRQLGGLEIGPDAIAITTEPLPAKIDAAALDLAAIVREALEHSAELAALAATRHAAEITAEAADSAAKSRLDLELAAGVGGADRAPGKALSSAVDHPGYSVTASLTFDHAIEGRSERGGQAAARAQVLAAKTNERDARARLIVRATRAVQRARAAFASIALGEEAMSLAEQNITAEQRRFELGKSTNFEVLRRQDELQQARLRHAAAIADYLTARADLDGLSGAILARYGIVMP
ncbi:MAG TPA: TolC family protein [Kofleriaceae bacterium]|jgi:outer membrane protein TolC|nr:TolC family protein [Kofleriaceae bacterium]